MWERTPDWGKIAAVFGLALVCALLILWLLTPGHQANEQPAGASRHKTAVAAQVTVPEDDGTR